MSEFNESLVELLDSLSLAQVCIEQTSSFILAHREHFREAMDIWSKYLQNRDDEKVICLLYLANDILQRLQLGDDRLAFGEVIMSEYKCFEPVHVQPIFGKLIKLWTERQLFPADNLKKFQMLLDELKTKQPITYNIQNIIDFLTKIHQTNDFIKNYQRHCRQFSNITNESTSEQSASDKLQDLKNRRHTCIEQLGDIKNETLNVRSQQAEFGALVPSFKNAVQKISKLLTNYCEYRDRIIQLRWKTENIKNKINDIKTKRENINKQSKETHEVTDMDVENIEEKSTVKREKSRRDNIQNMNSNLFPPPAFLFNTPVTPIYPQNFPLPYIENVNYPYPDQPPPVTNVIDYNHGFNQISMVYPPQSYYPTDVQTDHMGLSYNSPTFNQSFLYLSDNKPLNPSMNRKL